MPTNFLLFDIDSVLVQPYGYRKAVFDTASHFLKKLGLSKVQITEEIISAFETNGIFSEWDMIPIFLLLSVELIFQKNNGNILNNNGQEPFLLVPANTIIPGEDEIIEFIIALESLQLGGPSACDLLSQKFQNHQLDEIFPYVINHLPWLLNDWIAQSKNIDKSTILQYFQNLTLGDKLFREFFPTQSFIKTEPYLTKYDRPLIYQSIVNEIEKLRGGNQVFTAVITARPSRYPDGKKPGELGISFPEAELALQCVGLNETPVVGFGAMNYLAELTGGREVDFIKPSPLHALSAMLVGGGLDLQKALYSAYDYLFNQQKEEVLLFFKNLRKPIHVFVFEDSTIGIQSLRKACQALRLDGLEITDNAFGISSNNRKTNALKKENAIIFPTINEAFSRFIEIRSESTN